MAKIVDLTGMKFERLLVVSRAENRGRETYWNCLCDCGNETIVNSRNLKKGTSKSCGCLRAELQSVRAYKHGMSDSRLYREYVAIKTRCYNPNTVNFHVWGGKGITMCDEWLDDKEKFFEWSIANGYNDSLTIDRIDNSKGYSPYNCRWIPLELQNRNKCKNVYVLVGDMKKLLIEFSEEYNLDYYAVYRELVVRTGTMIVDCGATKERVILCTDEQAPTI